MGLVLKNNSRWISPPYSVSYYMFLEEQQIREGVRKLIALAIQFKIPWTEMPDRIEEKIDFRPGPNTPEGPARRDLRLIIEEEINLRKIEIMQKAIARGRGDAQQRTPANRATTRRCPKCGRTFARSATEIPLDAIVHGAYQGQAIAKVAACTACDSVYCLPGCIELPMQFSCGSWGPYPVEYLYVI